MKKLFIIIISVFAIWGWVSALDLRLNLDSRIAQYVQNNQESLRGPKGDTGPAGPAGAAGKSGFNAPPAGCPGVDNSGYSVLVPC